MMKCIFIAAAGAVGALSRYGISGLMARLFGSNFPYGTLTANVIGCFLLGLIMQSSLTTTVIPQDWRVPITVGFLGALTTFSTFSYETVKLLESSSYILALANIGCNLIIGLLATIIGFMISKIAFGG